MIQSFSQPLCQTFSFNSVTLFFFSRFFPLHPSCCSRPHIRSCLCLDTCPLFTGIMVNYHLHPSKCVLFQPSGPFRGPSILNVHTLMYMSRRISLRHVKYQFNDLHVEHFIHERVLETRKMAGKNSPFERTLKHGK